MKKIYTGALILLLILSLLLSYFQTKRLQSAQQEVSVLKRRIAQLTIQKPGEYLYKDKNNKFILRIPYGWDIVDTGETDMNEILIKMKGVENPTEYIRFAMARKRLYDEESLNKSYMKLMTEEREDIFSNSPVKYKYTDVSFKGREAVLEECDHLTVKGAGAICDGIGDHFTRTLFIRNENGDECFFDFESSRKSPIFNVDLTQWIDRVSFIGADGTSLIKENASDFAIK